VELPNHGYLPTRARLQPLQGEWREPGPQLAGQIVEDWLDGRRVYPEPPRPARDLHRLRRLQARISPPVWCFVLLASAQAATSLADLWPSSSWNGSAPRVADEALRLACACAATLLPAAVLIWRSDAWRSARPVLAGAIVWTTLPATAGLGWWIARRSPGLMDQLGYAAAVVVAVAAVAAYFGPAILALGLERARRTRTEWLPFFVGRAAIVTAFVALLNSVRWLPYGGGGSFQQIGGGLDPLNLAGSIAGAALPFELLCLLVLALSCLSAVLAEEAQSRLWQCAAAGATLLVCASLYALLAGELLASVATSDPTSRSWNTVAATAIVLAGRGLVLLAFASPAWSAAGDAEGSGRAAPDEIFTWGAAAGANARDSMAVGTIMAVAAGTDHALALDEHGQVYGWGDDSAGQASVPDGLSDVVAIAAGDRFSLALRSDGTVGAWGANELGQTAVPPDLEGVTAIAAGNGFALALKADGTVAGWGDDSRGATRVPAELAGVTAISAGEGHGLAQLADGAVVAWGDNSYGQLDVPKELTNVTAISAGAFHALALRADGDVSSWGGGGDRPNEAEHPWRLITVKAIAAGDGFSLAVRAMRAPYPSHGLGPGRTGAG
jgi:hypothetical protein